MSRSRSGRQQTLCVAQQQDSGSGSGIGGGILAGIKLAPTLAALFAFGAIVGPPLDGIHTNVNLLEYDKLPVTIGSWKTSLADPILLGSYYAVAGGLLLALDRWLGTQDDERRIARHANPAWVALSYGVLAAYLQTSSTFFTAEVPISQIWLVLVLTGAAAWKLTDGSRSGLLLAAVSALICPVAEVALMQFAGLWHYPRADLFIGGNGITSWTACCYAYYTVVVGNLARWLAVYFSEE